MKSTLVIKDMATHKQLTSKEMSAVIGGFNLGSIFISVGQAIGEAAGAVYCSKQGTNCGGATTNPK